MALDSQESLMHYCPMCNEQTEHHIRACRGEKTGLRCQKCLGGLIVTNAGEHADPSWEKELHELIQSLEVDANASKWEDNSGEHPSDR